MHVLCTIFFESGGENVPALSQLRGMPARDWVVKQIFLVELGRALLQHHAQNMISDSVPSEPWSSRLLTLLDLRLLILLGAYHQLRETCGTVLRGAFV